MGTAAAGETVTRPLPALAAASASATSSTVWHTRWLDAAPAQAVGELHAAAGAAGDDDVGARGGDLRRLAGADLAGEGRVREQERPGAAAADLGRGELHEVVTGDAGDELARLAAHALAARQVARVVVGDAQAGRGGGRRQVDALGEVLGGVGGALARGPRRAAPSPGRPPAAAG